MHRYGSRDWLDTNWDKVQTAGESLTASHTWDNGQPPNLIPLPIVRGSPLCIAQGETTAGGVSSALLVNGFLPSCYNRIGIAEDPWIKATSINLCSTQRAWMNVIQWMYNGNPDQVTTFLRAWLGQAFTINYHPSVGNFPSFITLVGSTWQAVIASGTANFQQLALQGWQSLLGPTDQGAFSTMPLWTQCAENFNTILQADGGLASNPTFMAGHSYGAAAAAVLKGLYQVANPAANNPLLTFGMPKIGDARMVSAITNGNEIHVVTDNDLVTILPPDYDQLARLVGAFGPSLLLRWVGWEKVSSQLVLQEDGTAAFATPPFPDSVTMIAMLTRVIAGFELEEIIGHDPQQYVERLNRRCPEIEWPLNEDANQWFALPDAYHLALLRGHPVPTSARLDLQAGIPPGGKVELRSIPKTDGSIVLGGETTAADGSIVLGGETTAPDGSIVLGGETTAPDGILGFTEPAAPPVPGASCGAAGNIPFGVLAGSTVAPFGQDWWTFPVTSGKTYTVTFSVTSGSGNCVVSTGSCAFPVPQFTLFGSGNNSFGPLMSSTNGYVQIINFDFTNPLVYTVQVDEA